MSDELWAHNQLLLVRDAELQIYIDPLVVTKSVNILC